MAARRAELTRTTKWQPTWNVAATRYGTPFYQYDLATVRARVGALHDALPPSVRVFYAVKANGNLALVGELRRLGCGADICSLGELETVRAAGFDAKDVLYTGPAKSDDEISGAVYWGVGLIVVESLAEAVRVSAVGRRERVRQPVLMRVNPGPALARIGIAIAAPSCKFGVDEQVALEVAREIQGLEGVVLRGIHVSTESNVRCADHLLERARYTFALANRLRAGGVRIEVVDLGGGFGVPHREGEAPLDVGVYGRGLREIAAPYPNMALVLELGRYPVAESGTYVVSVRAVKQAEGATFVLVDGGINHLYRPRLTPVDRPPSVVVSRPGQCRRVTVCGPLLDSEDVLAEGVDLPDVSPGDLLAFPTCGAYGFNHGLQGFCLHPNAAEVVWDGHQLHLVRERSDTARITDGQYSLPLRSTPGAPVGNV